MRHSCCNISRCSPAINSHSGCSACHASACLMSVRSISGVFSTCDVLKSSTCSARSRNSVLVHLVGQVLCAHRDVRRVVINDLAGVSALNKTGCLPSVCVGHDITRSSLGSRHGEFTESALDVLADIHSFSFAHTAFVSSRLDTSGSAKISADSLVNT